MCACERVRGLDRIVAGYACVCCAALLVNGEARSALFRHEVAYVLGQLQHAAAAPALEVPLRSIV